MSTTLRVLLLQSAMLAALGAGCASPGAPVASRADMPNAPTVDSTGPKIDSIEARFGFVAAQLSARIDSLRSVVYALAQEASASASKGSSELERRPSSESEVIRSYAVAAGFVAGIVLDSETGRPIAGAQVTLSGKAIGALSDSAGHFNIQNVPPGDLELAADLIGYGSVLLRVGAGAPEGVVARFVLHPRARVECEGLTYRRVGATVRDALTGLAPATATALRVSNAHDRWWDLGTAEPGADRLNLAVLPDGGPLNIEVVAEGHTPWYRSGVETTAVTSGSCRGATDLRLNVWLLPTDDLRWRRDEAR